jgi:hypothetical protein
VQIIDQFFQLADGTEVKVKCDPPGKEVSSFGGQLFRKQGNALVPGESWTASQMQNPGATFKLDKSLGSSYKFVLEANVSAPATMVATLTFAPPPGGPTPNPNPYNLNLPTSDTCEWLYFFNA